MLVGKITLILVGFTLLLLPLLAYNMEENDRSLPVQTVSEVTKPSSIGEVYFPHEFHFSDMEMECNSCHHEVSAKMLDIPHREYFVDFWIECGICHHENQEPVRAQSCSNCHHASDDCGDETLSAKVVIHKSCWECHESGEGLEASKNCKFCHSGPKSYN